MKTYIRILIFFITSANPNSTMILNEAKIVWKKKKKKKKKKTKIYKYE